MFAEPREGPPKLRFKLRDTAGAKEFSPKERHLERVEVCLHCPADRGGSLEDPAFLAKRNAEFGLSNYRSGRDKREVSGFSVTPVAPRAREVHSRKLLRVWPLGHGRAACLVRIAAEETSRQGP